MRGVTDSRRFFFSLLFHQLSKLGRFFGESIKTNKDLQSSAGKEGGMIYNLPVSIALHTISQKTLCDSLICCLTTAR